MYDPAHTSPVGPEGWKWSWRHRWIPVHTTRRPCARLSAVPGRLCTSLGGGVTRGGRYAVTGGSNQAAVTSGLLAGVRDTALLRVEDLSVRFGTLRAVSGVSFEVSKGEFFGIVGESGSGKSITARSLINLLPSSAVASGSVLFREQDVLRASGKDLRSLRGRAIGFVFQDAVAALDPVYTIGAQLVEAYMASTPGVSVGVARRRANDLLAEVGISDPERCLASYPHQLSGGMKQRVVIAAALISDPELIIADEPTTALDVTVQRQVLELLQGVVANRGVSAIIITHDLGVVAEVCDRVAVFYGGMIIEEADTETLFSRPRHPYTSALLDSLPKLGTRKAFKAIPGAPPKISKDVGSCPFQPRCARAMPECSAAMPPDIWADAGRFRCHNPLP